MKQEIIKGSPSGIFQLVVYFLSLLLWYQSSFDPNKWGKRIVCSSFFMQRQSVIMLPFDATWSMRRSSLQALLMAIFLHYVEDKLWISFYRRQIKFYSMFTCVCVKDFFKVCFLHLIHEISECHKHCLHHILTQYE